MSGRNGRAGRILVLAMGNDLLSDDGAALHASRLLRWIAPDHVDVVETSEAGFALLEFLEGYPRALILDAIRTGKHAPGTLMQLTQEDFAPIESPSPHYAGLPDLRALADQSGISFPDEVLMLAMEVRDPYSIGEELTPEVSMALQDYVRAAADILMRWPRNGSLLHEHQPAAGRADRGSERNDIAS